MRRFRRWAASGLVAALVATGATASAATTTGFGVFAALAGAATTYTTTMQLPGAGYPAAEVTSDSRSGGVGVQSGASTWFGAASPPGRRFGSSRGHGYLNLRPRADNASSPSRTVYTFTRPAPTGWGFVLGDIDSDEVSVSATLADGSPASTEDLGFEGVFNLCGSSPRPSGCSGSQAEDTPTWHPGTATLRGNGEAEDTYGAAGWFVPRARLASLALTFTRRAGFPVYQTWFAARAQDVTGTVRVDDGACALGDVVLHLVDADGTEVARTSPGADGSYAFDAVAASDGLTVRVDGLPPDCLPDGPTSRAVDLRDGDDVADFAVHQAVPGTGTIAGRVSEAGTGDPVAGATLELTGPAGYDVTRTSDTDGSYTFPDVPPGTYAVRITPPPGSEVVGTGERAVSITDAGESLPDEDFTVRPVVVPGSVTGHVRDAADDPVPDATVAVRGPGAEVTTVTTGADGDFRVPDLQPGDYTAALTPPPGTEVVGGRTRPFTVTGLGETVTVDFRLRAAPATPAAGGGGTSGPARRPAVRTTASPAVTTLPDTGGVDRAWPVAGGGLLLAGTGCLLVARRRSARAARPRT